MVGSPTYAVFVDFKKVFDKVRHEALYRILEHMGVRGAFLTFIKEVFCTSHMHVKVGGCTMHSSGMRQGTQQGCPLSPLLFISFVNHLLCTCTAGGVTIPGVDLHCTSGKYADDVVGLEESNAAAKTLINQIHQWGKKWGMELGFAKCGVLLVNGNANEHMCHHATDYSTPNGTVPIGYVCISKFLEEVALLWMLGVYLEGDSFFSVQDNIEPVYSPGSVHSPSPETNSVGSISP